MGKLVGGGLPCGSVGGTDEVMKCLDPRTRQLSPLRYIHW